MASFDSFLPPHLGNTPTPTATQTSQVISAPMPRPPRREGAVIILSAAEQAMEDAMSRSTPTPEPVLGKRTHNSTDGDDTEPDDEPSTTPQPESSSSLSSNVAAATVRYAAKKKLRPEQRDEVDAFLLVSLSLFIV